MKEMTLVDVQNVSLDILKDVHNFCESHHIRYSLAYGTLIGAIRHKGFIPWDDDVDIVIPRPDFNRFCEEYRSSCGYVLYTPDNSQSFLSYARVCDNEHTIVKTNLPWTFKPTGVWIDVFPLDGLPSDENDFMVLVKEIRDIQKIVDRLRTGKYLHFSDTMDLKTFLKCIVKRMLYFKYDLRSLLHRHIQLIQNNKYNESEFCGQLCVMDYPEKEHNPKSDFENFIKVSFEDSEFCTMNGYDNILRRYYGNYMELPPEEKRIPPQKTTHRFYWLDEKMIGKLC